MSDTKGEHMSKLQGWYEDNPRPVLPFSMASDRYWLIMYEYKEKENQMLRDEVIRLQALLEPPK